MRRTSRSSVPWSRAWDSLLVDILLEYEAALVECQLEAAAGRSRRHPRRSALPSPGARSTLVAYVLDFSRVARAEIRWHPRARVQAGPRRAAALAQPAPPVQSSRVRRDRASRRYGR